jgi:3-(methylthio)propanoyl-CoA dehydrogenase
VANDLIEAMTQTIAELGLVDAAAPQSAKRPIEAMQQRLKDARDAFARAVAFIVATGRTDPNAVFAGSVPYLKLAGVVLCGWQMARALIAAAANHNDDQLFYDAKIATAHFYADFILPQANAFEVSIISARDGEGLLALSADQF